RAGRPALLLVLGLGDGGLDVEPRHGLGQLVLDQLVQLAVVRLDGRAEVAAVELLGLGASVLGPVAAGERVAALREGPVAATGPRAAGAGRTAAGPERPALRTTWLTRAAGPGRGRLARR